MNELENLKRFLHEETVLTIAALLAACSMFAVPPDGRYFGYVHPYRFYCRSDNGGRGNYLAVFSLVNFPLMAVLLLVSKLFFT